MLTDGIFILSFVYLIIRSFDMTYDLIIVQVTSSPGHMILFHQHHLPRFSEPI